MKKTNEKRICPDGNSRVMYTDESNKLYYKILNKSTGKFEYMIKTSF